MLTSDQTVFWCQTSNGKFISNIFNEGGSRTKRFKNTFRV